MNSSPREVEAIFWYDGKESFSIDSDADKILVYVEEGTNRYIMEIDRRTRTEVARHNARYVHSIIFKVKEKS